MLTRRKFLAMLGKGAGTLAVLPFVKPIIESMPKKPSVEDDYYDIKREPVEYSAGIATSGPLTDETFVQLLDGRLNKVYMKALTQSATRLQERMAADAFKNAFTPNWE